ncbi:neutral trehalase [Tothia fuscella]|uniref:Trehalase n=1 Tax=Tothia fuscella TaxID=1048955 RepID=A0A9P4U040_9PEZI|nr:neutral trehalase [Tothia fuscella]
MASPYDISLKVIYNHNNLDALPAKTENYLVEVNSSLKALLLREDTDENHQITIDDTGPKSLTLRTASSGGFHSTVIRGTYAISNILGVLTFANDDEERYTIIDGSSLVEDPVTRLSSLIKQVFWHTLTRRLDASVIAIAAPDSKDWTENPRPRIYVPPSCTDQIDYYQKAATSMPELNLDVQVLPELITEDVYKQMLSRPGLMALDMESGVNAVTGDKELHGRPFVVPGGRFNELYNWDTYFISIGLLASGYTSLVKNIVLNFVFEIQHYGLIPNANRSYYLVRSQPPFLTSLARQTYEVIRDDVDAKDFLKRAVLAAIKEYNQVWMAEPRYDPVSGLSRYRPRGFGVPKECEAGAFDAVLHPYMKKYNMSSEQFVQAYESGKVQEPDLDEYFLHDRAVRESGHDISLRMEGVCADLGTVDLNSLLYKYETDIMEVIRDEFDGELEIPQEFCAPGQVLSHIETAAEWQQKADSRKQVLDTYLWNEERGMYLDYNTKTGKQHTIESVTCFWPLWSGAASEHQAKMLIEKALPKFEMVGGLVSTAKESLPNGGVGLHCHEQHQWDFPYAWAPHQVMAWDGFKRYGYHKVAERVCYRWLRTVLKVFVDFNGTVVEKYDVTNERDPHKVFAEYGNQGLDFKGFAREGFGWTNASFQYGLSIINPRMRRPLEVCAPFDSFGKGM